MNFSFKKIIDFGANEENLSHKNASIKVANVIALVYLSISLIYGMISLFTAPQLVPVIVFLFLGTLVYFALIYFEIADIARIWLSILFNTVIMLYYGIIVQPGEPPIDSLHIGQLMAALLPLIYISIKERLYLSIALSYGILLFFIQPMVNEYIDVPMDSSFFREPVFTVITYTFALGILIFNLLFMQFTNLDAEKKNKKLMEDLQAQNSEVEKQQKELLHTLEENNKSSEIEEKRNWIAKGISEMSNLMRGDVNEQFFQQIVSELVKFMGVNQSGLYTVEEYQRSNEKHIELKACYAFDRNKFLKKRIEIGQGLIGQCYLEKERIYLREIPESYINITSGLGGSNPTCLLIVPLIHEDNVEGLIEIASFHDLEEHEIEFVEQLSEALASFISSNRKNQNTKILLEQSQQQSEEMRAKEEEMRQTMEEMQATQEEIVRKEKEHVQQIEMLKKEIESLRTTKV